MKLEKFAERMKDLISENLTGVTQVGLEIGLGETNLSRYANARSAPTLSAAVRIADYFNVTLDYLFGLADGSREQTFGTCPPFYKRLDEVLGELNVTKYRLTKLTGIAESNIRYWRQGKTEPSIESVIKIAEALGCTVDFLVGRGK